MFEELNDLFAQVEKTAGQFEELPEGNYIGVIEACGYKESKKGRPMVQIMVRVTGGEHEGRTNSKFMMLDGSGTDQIKRNLSMFASQAKRLGVDTSEGFETTIENMERLEGTAVEMTIEKSLGNNGVTYTNTHLDLADE